jgi:hypothetical protein
MRVLTLALTIASLTAAAPLAAQAQAAAPKSSAAATSTSKTAMKDCSAQWQAMKKAGTAHGSYKDFSKTCLSSKSAAAPSKSQMAANEQKAPRTTGQTRMQRMEQGTAAAPAAKNLSHDAANATAKCKDGTYSHAKTHSGACSGHGGVEQWMK